MLIFETLKAFYLNKEHCSEFYIERNENNCQGFPNVVEDNLFPVQAVSFK